MIQWFLIFVWLGFVGIDDSHCTSLKAKLQELKEAHEAQLISTSEFQDFRRNLLQGFLEIGQESSSDAYLASRMEDLKTSNKGLIQFYFVCETSENKVIYQDGVASVSRIKMPGYLKLEVRDHAETEVKAKLKRSVYSNAGTRLSPGTGFNHGTVLSKTRVHSYPALHDLHFFIYTGEVELEAGAYRVEVSRRFKTSQITKTRRYRRFVKVEVQAGKITWIPYYWSDHKKFGLDFFPSKAYLKAREDELALIAPWLAVVIE